MARRSTGVPGVSEMAGNFYLVRCNDCENEQVVFGKASTEVACAVCGTTLARPTGGNAQIDHEILETVERRTADGRSGGDSTEAPVQ